MATAIALIVAGSGETSEQEVFDLLEDAYPGSEYEEIGLVVPADKDLFTKTVQHAVGWYSDDEGVYPIQTKGAAMSRASSKLGSGTQEVEKFSDILTCEEFKDWDEVHFLVAMPDDPEDPDYDLYAEMVETAIDNGLAVKDLTKALDDVTLAPEEEPEEPEAAAPEPDPEPDPEPEPEKAPRRGRSRARKTEDQVNDEETQEARSRVADGLQEQLAQAAHEAQAEGGDSTSQNDIVYTAIQEVITALYHLQEAFRPPSVAPKEGEAVDDVVVEEVKTSRGRGRPRKHFDVPQIWDEDEEEWVPRPKGRMRKGTKWRTIHAETNEVLEEGTA